MLQDATHDTEFLWSIERWVQTRSFRLPDPPKLPALKDRYGGPDLTTHRGKAKALAGKFFSSPLADLSDIGDPSVARAWELAFRLPATVGPKDIARALSRAAP